ncbi:uncharacterized protein LOC127787374 isoform X2 [Diospyros lotus]|uniref:uncharacterized protein LOC127787374 isoform X2 n=1 Tax=Diospyros lotus TaxID=55363 RepID=UPI00225AD100|nr:uncharacterized protein LOC127787374 isoform X2 [Diospyros lotus]
MMDLTAVFLELVATIIILVAKPFSLLKLSCIFGLRSLWIVIHTWVELLRAAVLFHVNILWRFMVWGFALISLPVRVLTALQRERMIELENHVWNRKELERRLQMAIKEGRMMEGMLAEMEDEHDEAIVKIELLQSQLQVAKEENLRLKEIQVKGLYNFQSHDNTSKDNDVGEKFGISWKSSFNEGGIILQDLMHKDTWQDSKKSKIESVDCTLARAGTKASEPRQMDMGEVTLGLCQQREVALLQSLFSAVLSMIVGMIIWEAEDPCMPLVVALFMVVGMSLKSVVQFFSTIRNKPASDAVALLSFNCFMLGALTYPTLPRIACRFGFWRGQ